jgi:CRP-like cAMP-binding protein
VSSTAAAERFPTVTPEMTLTGEIAGGLEWDAPSLRRSENHGAVRVDGTSGRDGRGCAGPHGAGPDARRLRVSNPPASPAPSGVVEFVTARLRLLAPLSGDDEALIQRSLHSIQTFEPDAEIYVESEMILRPRIIISGWAARTRIRKDGRRQILKFVVPGDGLGLRYQSRPRGPTSTIALTRVAACDATALRDGVETGQKHAALVVAFGAMAMLDELFLYNQIIRLGRMTAYEKVSHLLLELCWRMAQVGALEDGAFPMPLTQEVLADALGLSIVHVNRTLQLLRREGRIELGAGVTKLKDPGLLAVLAEYADPSL